MSQEIEHGIQPLTDTQQTITDVQPENTSIQTTIAEVNLAPAITETSNFRAVLAEIPIRVQEADNLLKAYREDKETFIETIDEAAVDAQLKQMQNVSAFVRDIGKSRTEIKKYFDGVRDKALKQLDDRLAGAQFAQLEQAQADIKQMKKDVEADRAANRWDEIKATFEANVNRYPLLGEFTPERADFSRFKLLFPKLVTGAKTRKVKEADHTFVNETLYTWDTAIQLMKENSWGLTVQDLNQLLTLFKQNPSVELVQREGRQLKINADAREKARIEAEQRRIEAERQRQIAEQQRQAEMARIQEQARLAKLAQDKEAQARAEQDRLALEERTRVLAEQEKQRAQEYAQFGGQYKTIFKESFPQFIAYLFANPSYHDVHGNPQTKAAVIYDIMHQIDNPDSVVTRETARDPQKVLDLVRYILDA